MTGRGLILLLSSRTTAIARLSWSWIPLSQSSLPPYVHLPASKLLNLTPLQDRRHPHPQLGPLHLDPRTTPFPPHHSFDPLPPLLATHLAPRLPLRRPLLSLSPYHLLPLLPLFLSTSNHLHPTRRRSFLSRPSCGPRSGGRDAPPAAWFAFDPSVGEAIEPRCAQWGTNRERDESEVLGRNA